MKWISENKLISSQVVTINCFWELWVPKDSGNRKPNKPPDLNHTIE